MTIFEALKDEWDREPRTTEETQTRLYAVERVLGIIDAEIGKIEYVHRHYPEFGWTPGGEEGRDFRRREHDTKELLFLIEAGLKTEQRKLKNRLKQA